MRSVFGISVSLLDFLYQAYLPRDCYTDVSKSHAYGDKSSQENFIRSSLITIVFIALTSVSLSNPALRLLYHTPA